MSHKSGRLSAPARNNYFYGKMLDVDHFQMEQQYFNRKRWMLNQLGLGAGVLCGLDLVVSDDGKSVWIRPGVAIDSHGHEIIVPAPYCLENPRQPTDPWGNPDGDPIIGSGVVTVCLGYHECEADPVPVLVGECDSQDECRPSTVRERYRVWVRPEELPGGSGLDDDQCVAIFPRPEPPASFDRRSAACLTLDSSCPEAPDDCVALGVITLPGDGSKLTAEACRQRTTVYSNATLFDMILCLADRVDACCRVRQLRYAAGDGQLAEAGGELAEPLVAEVIDGAGNLISNEPVNWRVRAGGGTLSAAETISDANGRVQATWVLGPEAGHNKSELFLENGASITFDATGMATTDDPAPAPPVVSKSWPPNGALLSARARRNRRQFEIWSEKPRIEFTFDQEMNEAQLDSVNPWLRVWQLQDKGEIVLRAVKLSRIDPLAERSKFTAAYALDNVDPDQAARYLVQVRSKEGNIISAGGLARQLDADFAGTKLTAAVLRKIWKIEEERTFGDRKVWDALVDTGKQLPSGDEAGGGVYHGWFAVGDGRNRLRRSDDR